MAARQRTVIGNIALSLDGRVSGAGGPYDMGWIVPPRDSWRIRPATE